MGEKGPSGKGAGADRTRLQIYLDAETKTALRIAAIKEGTNASALVERLIADYLKGKRRG